MTKMNTRTGESLGILMTQTLVQVDVQGVVYLLAGLSLEVYL